MQKALTFIALSAAAGFASARALSEQGIGLVLSHYGQAGEPVTGSLGWLGFAVLAAAALAAVVAPAVTRTKGITTMALAFAGSIASSIAVCALSVGCASAALAAPIALAQDAIAHANHWLFIGWLFAQLAVAGAMLVVRSHDDTKISDSSFAMQGYAALKR